MVLNIIAASTLQTASELVDERTYINPNGGERSTSPLGKIEQI
jgi:hypothetical protein